MNNTTQDLLAAYDLKKEYTTPSGELEILKGVHLTLEPGEAVYVFGRSGSGKSTLLHLLGGLDQATSGKILFEGEDMTLLKERELARVRNRRIGFVFQSYYLLPELTLYENVLLPTMIAGRRNDKWTKECLKRVKLYSRADHYPSELSGGEKQRAAIARALANRPSVVLCDEPTGNLDEETAGIVMSLLEDLNRREGQAFIIVTHDEALAWHAHRTYRLVDGILIPEARGPVNVEKIS
ncbi:MAG: ABC transporter ATP-binding protein [Candidatus Omnitrophota bacterium]|nr:ABC transporter ATP-binding protein [Candidatus Omnitrophota bacterium]